MNTEQSLVSDRSMRTLRRVRLVAATGLSVLASVCTCVAQTSQPSRASSLIEKIQHDLSGPSTQDAAINSAIPHGTIQRISITDSTRYPGSESNIQVYVPAQYDPVRPACLLVKLDGLGAGEATVLDNLIASGAIPTLIGVGIAPGAIFKDPPATPHRAAVRYDRSFEFDSTNDRFADFVLEEVLPAVQRLKTADGRAIRISSAGNDHAATGASTGGIGAFTLAWRRPDQFTRVYSVIGTFVSMRGGSDYPELIRKTDPKPIRIFLEDGSTDAWNALFGSWYDANVNMESALKFAGYDVAHAWGTHGHNGGPGQVIFPDVMRWLWRDYPSPIKPGESQNSTLREITLAGQQWEMITMPVSAEPSGLAADSRGNLLISDAGTRTIYKLDQNGPPAVWGRPSVAGKYAITAEAVGPDDTLYGAVPGDRQIVAIAPDGSARPIVSEITAHDLVVTHDGTVVASESGAHPDEASTIWEIRPNGERRMLDRGLSAASGVAFSPDGSLFYAAEHSTKWIYSFVVQPDGSLIDKQPFDWLHMTDVPNDSGAEALAVDLHGNLYVATRMGVQVCDQNGRVRAILPLPTPCRPLQSICFGGPKFDVLYVSDGRQLYKRSMKVPGCAPWAAPVKIPSQGAG